MPEVVKIDIMEEAEIGLAVEGSKEACPDSNERCELPEFSVYTDEKHYIEIFNKGISPFEYEINCKESRVKLNSKKIYK